MNNQSWQPFAFPQLPVRFRYPHTTPQGQPVLLDELRIHFRSKESSEVYFELSRNLNFSAHEVYEREKRFVEEGLEGGVVDAFLLI